MTASKTRPAKYEDLVVLQVLMAKHYSAAAIHLEIYAVYEQILRIKGELYKKLHSIGYVHLNMNERMGITNIVHCSHSFLNMHVCSATFKWTNPIAYNLLAHNTGLYTVQISCLIAATE